MWWWRVRYCMWWAFLVLFALYCAALLCGVCILSVRKWREGHWITAIIYPTLTVTGTWALMRWQKNHPNR